MLSTGGGCGSSSIISHDSHDSLRDTQLILIETITKQSLLIISPFIGLVLFNCISDDIICIYTT